MAFGGAGMLVSDPLMLEMYNIWDRCYEEFRHHFGGESFPAPFARRAEGELTSTSRLTGDEMVTRCAAVAKGATKQTVTTEERGLHRELVVHSLLHRPLTQIRRAQSSTFLAIRLVFCSRAFLC